MFKIDMNPRIDPIINNSEPVYEVYKSAEFNPLKWLWFPQYKCASRSTETLINRNLRPTWNKDLNNSEHGYNKFKNCTLYKDLVFESDKPMYEKLGWRSPEWSIENPKCIAPAILPNDSINNYTTFTFVRNPWDRMVSCWLDKRYGDKKNISKEQEVTFKEFVIATKDFLVRKYNNDMMQHGNPHLCALCSNIFNIEIDFVGKVENYTEDCVKLCKMLNIALPPEVFHNNKTTGRGNYQSYYCGETKKIVQEMYLMDIEKFGYKY